MSGESFFTHHLSLTRPHACPLLLQRATPRALANVPLCSIVALRYTVMMRFAAIIALAMATTATGQDTFSTDKMPCQNVGGAFADRCSGHGVCSATEFCTCEKPYVNKNSEPCAQESVSALTTLLHTLFLGGVGFPWFFTAQGNQCQVCCGVTKLLVGWCTLGIWALVDIIRVATMDHMGGGTELEGVIPMFPDL